MRRIKAKLSYDGTEFAGWQVQPSLATVQGRLQEALEQIEGEPVAVTGSGRTDAGVHALAQVAAFTIANPIPPANLRKALNRLLPRSIRILEVEPAAESFHPIRDALAKTYEYRILRREICSPFERHYVLHYPYPLDEPRMAALAPLLEGTHDFSRFAAADKSDTMGRSKVRTLFSSRLAIEPGRLTYRVRGSGFLKHMVRNIAGLLLEAGRGKLDERGIERYLSLATTAKAGPTAPARGLFLHSVEYPDAQHQSTMTNPSGDC